MTFVQTVNAGSQNALLYDVGAGPCANIVQTNGSTPPLDSVRGNTVATVITSGVSVPTMAGWMTWVLAALLVGGAGYQIRRRRLA